MVQVLWETVFLQVLMPEGTCAPYGDKASCNAVPNAIVPGALQCKWTKADGGACSAADPPGDITFSAIISCFIITFALPIQMFLAFLYEEYLCLKPDWGVISLCSGSQRNETRHERGPKKSKSKGGSRTNAVYIEEDETFASHSTAMERHNILRPVGGQYQYNPVDKGKSVSQSTPEEQAQDDVRAEAQVHESMFL